MKTLADLWAEAGCKPFCAIDKDKRKFRVVEIAPDMNALGWESDGIANIHNACLERWALHKEKKLVAHWPAIIYHNAEDVLISDNLYSSEEQPKKTYTYFLRLATELPPIMLEVDGE